MPLQIIRQDITGMQTDAVVNPTNSQLLPGGGTDEAIHKAAGSQLYDALREIGSCPKGEVRVTGGYNLNCKYIIHTVGPVWHGGLSGEKRCLKECYMNSLKKAHSLKCESIAIPLISSGTYGYPKDKVLKVAINTISDFLMENEMMVYLCVYDKRSYELSEKLFRDITQYIDDLYVESAQTQSISRRRFAQCEKYEDTYECSMPFEEYNAAPCSASVCSVDASMLSDDIEDFIKLEDSFTMKLLKLIDIKDMDDIVCYKRANVSKQTWYKIMNDKNYKPNKKTVISFAIALCLTLDETQSLLESVGFILSKSSMFDAIIIYCVTHKIYDVLEVDSILFKYDQETLFSKV